MENLMMFALRLLKKFATAPPVTREKLSSFYVGFKNSGVLPLGIHPDDDGEPAYWWLVFDRDRIHPERALRDYLKSRSPPRMRQKILYL